jgi:hypothetical protein
LPALFCVFAASEMKDFVHVCRKSCDFLEEREKFGKRRVK